MYGIIYLVTFPNGKMYIGQTTKDLEHRKSRHKSEVNLGSKYSFHMAINKYGFENLKWEMIDTAFNQEELNDKERYYIRKYRTYTRYKNSNGYNRTLGGEGVRGLVHSNESIKKMSDAMKGKYIGSKNPSARKIVCLNTGEIFKTMKEAAETYDCPYSHITSCCTGTRLSCGVDDRGNKLVWMYYEEYKKLTKEEIIEKIKYAEESRLGENHHFYNKGMSEESKKKMSESAIKRYKNSEHPRIKKVRCITTDEVFKSIADGIIAATISSCCTGKRKSAGTHPMTREKMLWEYV